MTSNNIDRGFMLSFVSLDGILPSVRMAEHPVWTVVSILAILYLFYLIGLASYRLYFSPIAHFPGPRLAALTFWYEFYWDVALPGQYTFQIEKLHKLYGPIVRINPSELHVMDPDFYEVLYAGSHKKRHKWSFYANAFGNRWSTFGTTDHDEHRMKRAVLNPAFSRKAVSSLEPVIREAVETMCRRFREWQQSQEPLQIRYAFGALPVDVITEYTFGYSHDCLNCPDFDFARLHSVDKVAEGGNFMKQFPWLLRLIMVLPPWLTIKLNPLMANVIAFQADIRGHVRDMKRKDREELEQDDKTLFSRILLSDLPASEKQERPLVEEAHTIVGAGQVTTADTLEWAIFLLLAHPETLAKLKSELESAIPNPNQIPSWSQLAQLPYLAAVISESLRVGTPLPTRLGRIAPDEDLVVNGQVIPAGTVIGMSALFMHYNKLKFPEPEKFKPERWLVPPAERFQLEKYLVPFSKGTRMCLGINLAEAELYLALASVIRRFEMELYETTWDDLRMRYDYLIPAPYADSKRCQVIFKK